MAFEFFDYLYQGFTGEYQLVSSLYRNGLDAVRPPADMGIDVVSLNLKEQLEKPGTAPETFFFQVKTSLITIPEEESEQARQATAFFKLKESEVDLLCQDSNRALVCYVYNHENDTLVNAYEAPFLCFWIDGSRLKTIHENGGLYLLPGDSKLTLQCVLRRAAHEGSHWYAAIANQQGTFVDEGYLGTIDSSNQNTQASDGADHYSIKGFLDFAHAGNSTSAASEESFTELDDDLPFD